MTAVEVPDALRLHPEHGAAAWRALGTYVDVRTAPDALDAVVELVAGVLDEVDETCSRFRADSDLSLANASPGHPVLVSPVLAGAVRVALEAARETGGLVDPTLGEVLTGAGYDRTYALVPGDDPSPASLPTRPGSWRDVHVDDTTVTVPPGASLDLGATGKSWAADLAALTVVDELGVPVLVSVGGDVRVHAPSDLPRPRSRFASGTASPTSRPAATSSSSTSGPVASRPPASRRGAGAAEAASGTTSSTPAPAHRPAAPGAPSPRSDPRPAPPTRPRPPPSSSARTPWPG